MYSVVDAGGGDGGGVEDADGGVSVEDARGTHDRRDWDCRLIPEFTKAVTFPLDRQAHKTATCRTNSDLDCMLDVSYRTRSMNPCLVLFERQQQRQQRNLFFPIPSKGELMSEHRHVET
jgi:hypothetical protein